MERIRQLRRERGLSQAKLAVTAGMDPATLNRLEQGKGNPNLQTLQRVAKALEVEVADLFPKAQAPLPLEEHQEQRGALPLGVLSDYILRRAQLWEQNLEKEEPRFQLDAVYEYVYQNEWVQREATMLIGALVQATLATAVAEGALPQGATITWDSMRAARAELRDIRAADNPEDWQRKAKEFADRCPADYARWFQERVVPTAYIDAFIRTGLVTAKWRDRAQAVLDWADSTDEFERHRELWADAADEAKCPPELAQARESAERAIKQREALEPFLEMMRRAA